MFWTKWVDDALVRGGADTERTPVGAPVFDDPAPVEHVAPSGPLNPHALLGWIDHAGPNAYTPPIQLDPNAPPRSPFPKPIVGTEEQLAAAATRRQAEELLTAPTKGKDETTVNVGAQAAQAMDLLTSIPDEQRGKMIDGLDDKAFEALMTNVPESERVRLSALVDASKDPKRKLRMWRTFHDGKMNTDLHRYAKLDRGKPDEDATAAQERNLQRYENRKRGVKDTTAEVDGELALLAAREKAGAKPEEMLAAIDEMRGRKDRELNVELEHNVNLTAQKDLRADGSRVVWSEPELEQMDAALDQLPEKATRNAKSLPQIMRTAPEHFLDTPAGRYLTGDMIEIRDNAMHYEKDRMGGDRQQVSKDVRREHGDTVGALEYTVTHEIGHDAEKNHAEAFKKFKTASGWTEIHPKEGAPDTTGLTARQKENLDNRRRKALNEDDVPVDADIEANGKVYTPYSGDKEWAGHYWAVDKTAIPSKAEIGNDRWSYGKGNPQEHFAEVYAKAVHLPETLYKDLVENPTAAATTARAKVKEQQRAIAQLKKHPTADSQAKIAALEGQMAQLESAAASAEKAKQQRGAQFGIMRDDVFGTDKVVEKQVARMREYKYDEAAILKFQQQAARLSTPAQVENLAAQVKR